MAGENHDAGYGCGCIVTVRPITWSRALCPTQDPRVSCQLLPDRGGLTSEPARIRSRDVTVLPTEHSNPSLSKNISPSNLPCGH